MRSSRLWVVRGGQGGAALRIDGDRGTIEAIGGRDIRCAFDGDGIEFEDSLVRVSGLHDSGDRGVESQRSAALVEDTVGPDRDAGSFDLDEETGHRMGEALSAVG